MWMVTAAVAELELELELELLDTDELDDDLEDDEELDELEADGLLVSSEPPPPPHALRTRASKPAVSSCDVFFICVSWVPLGFGMERPNLAGSYGTN